MSKDISIAEAGAWTRHLAARMPEAAKRGLYGAAVRLQQRLQNDGGLPKDRGGYRAGWRAEPTERGAEVFNLTTQALMIEEGVRAGNVKVGRLMIDALVGWAKRKGLGVTYAPKKGGGQRRSRPTEAALRSIAWAIAMSMKRRGIFQPPQRPLERTVRAYGPQFIREEVRREVQKEFER